MVVVDTFAVVLATSSYIHGQKFATDEFLPSRPRFPTSIEGSGGEDERREWKTRARERSTIPSILASARMDSNDAILMQFFFFVLSTSPPPSPSPPSFPLVFPWFEWSEVVTRKEREGKGEREEKEKKEEKEDGGSFRWSVIDRIWRGSNFGGGCTRFRPPKAGEESRWVLPGRGRGEGRNPRC